MNEINTNSSVSNFSAKAGAGAVDKKELNSWYEAMAGAWGSALDNQAIRITELADAVTKGGDKPSDMTILTAESLKMQFMSNNASTSTTSVGQALETLARK